MSHLQGCTDTSAMCVVPSGDPSSLEETAGWKKWCSHLILYTHTNMYMYVKPLHEQRNNTLHFGANPGKVPVLSLRDGANFNRFSNCCRNIKYKWRPINTVMIFITVWMLLEVDRCRSALWPAFLWPPFIRGCRYSRRQSVCLIYSYSAPHAHARGPWMWFDVF